MSYKATTPGALCPWTDF